MSWRRFGAGAPRNVAEVAELKAIIGPDYGSQWSRPNRITDDPPSLALVFEPGPFSMPLRIRTQRVEKQ